ncbi:MAG: PqqD family peptide modification chaperone [Nitrososphaeraceae archaeon]
MSSQKVTDEQVFDALRKCMDPEIPVNVVDLGLIYNVRVHPTNDVGIEMTMTTRGCPLHDTLVSDVKRSVGKITGIANVDVKIVWEPPWTSDKINPAVREKLGIGKPTLRFQIDYEKYKPARTGKLTPQEDGSLVLLNDSSQAFMVNQAIVDFWNSCEGNKTVTELTDDFSKKLGMTRQQVEKEVLQLVEQLFDSGLLQPPQ